MTGDTTVTVSLIFSGLTAIGVIYSIVSSRKSDVEGSTKKAVETATRFTELNVKLDMITQQFAEVIRSNEKRADEIATLNHNISSISSKIERLFEYKDALEKRIARLEGGAYEGKRMHSDSAKDSNDL